jgi:hypothetical protein
MPCVAVCALGSALTAAVWLPWRSRYRGRLLRAVVTALLVIATGVSMEAIRELQLAAASGEAVGASLWHMVVH